MSGVIPERASRSRYGAITATAWLMIAFQSMLFARSRTAAICASNSALQAGSARHREIRIASPTPIGVRQTNAWSVPLGSILKTPSGPSCR